MVLKLTITSLPSSFHTRFRSTVLIPSVALETNVIVPTGAFSSEATAAREASRCSNISPRMKGSGRAS